MTSVAGSIDREVLRGNVHDVWKTVTAEVWALLTKHSRVRLAHQFVLNATFPFFIIDDIEWSPRLFNLIGDTESMERIVDAIPIESRDNIATIIVNSWYLSNWHEPLMTHAIVMFMKRWKPQPSVMCTLFNGIKKKLDSTNDEIRNDGSVVLSLLTGDDSEDDTVDTVEGDETVRSLKECLDLLTRRQFSSTAKTVAELAAAMSSSKVVCYPLSVIGRMVKEASEREIVTFGCELVHVLFGIRDERCGRANIDIIGDIARRQASVSSDHCVRSIRFVTSVLLSKDSALGEVMMSLECLSAITESLAAARDEEKHAIHDRPKTTKRMSLAEMKLKGIKSNRFCSAPRVEGVSINYLCQFAKDITIPLQKVHVFRREIEALDVAERLIGRISYLTT